MYVASVLEVRDSLNNVAFRYLVVDRKTKKVVFEGPNRKSRSTAHKDAISFLYGKIPDSKEESNALGQ